VSAPTSSWQRAVEGRLEAEELCVLRFLWSSHPQLVAPFLSAVPRARRATLNRLTSSVLREGVAGLASEFHEPPAPVEGIEELNLDSGKTSKVLRLAGEGSLIVSVAGSYAFGRLEVEGPVLHVSAGGIRKLRHAAELLRLIHRGEANDNPRGHWVEFERQLENGSANLALAYAYHEEKGEQLRRVASECGANTVLDLVLTLQASDGTFDPALFFEQLCVEGHNLHPGAKTKTGMKPEAVYRYAPELEGAPDLRLVGIRRDRAESASLSGRDVGEILFNQHLGLWEAVTREFAQRGLPPTRYLFLPVHPWQLENVVPEVYRAEISKKVVVPVEGASVPGRATSSFRTVVPRAGRGMLAMKTSVDSQMTSTIRSISPNTANNAPEFTRLIRAILRREPRIARTFVPVCEVAGANFKADQNEANPRTRMAKSRNLSAVLRENVSRHAWRDELAIVGCALYAGSPITGKPILAELVEAFARSGGGSSSGEAAFRFVSEYASVILPGFLAFMVKYGVGLEGHLQNSVPVFKAGRPVRLLFRDWGGARIHGERLRRRGLRVGFYPGSAVLTDSVQEMRNKVFCAVFQNQLGEIILQSCKHFGVPERDLWQEVRRICDAIFDEIGSHPEHAAAAAADREALYGAEVDHKALTAMRLDPKGGYRYSRVPNPLHWSSLQASASHEIHKGKLSTI
jgi:siderophore synthetase component